ncbi:MAG TPA: carboxypeptidase regulatory-like domain-containing protein [Bryobacteraceae bacterium]|nr:carboxypeptidase regulatory-like domain-containing protein [Bryobacteraceae bacterium]
MKLSLLLLAPAVLCAQNATLSGLVKDAAQGAIPEASLIVSQAEAGVERTAKSNISGLYGITALPPGHYRITVEAPGFQPKSLENIELQPDQNARLDFTLEGAAAEIRGSVTDAHGGEALAGTQIQLAGTPYRVASDATGHFRMTGIPAGEYVLNVSTVGYHMERHVVRLSAGGSTDVSVVLTPDTLRQSETVNAQTDPFESSHGDSPDVIKLAGTDAKNLGSVLADDPLRAVQALPGVTSNRDVEARFSLRGAGFDRIGLYLDGVLLHEPFHVPNNTEEDGSVTAFNPDMVEEMELHKGAFPVRFEDRTVGILDVETRDGTRNAMHFQGSASASLAGGLAEGPFGGSAQAKPKGSWLVAVRKSYLQYILHELSSSSSNIPVFNMEDVQARFTYDLSAKTTLTFSMLESYSGLNQSNRTNPNVNTVLLGHYHYSLANLAWKYAPTSRLLFVSHLAWMREKGDDTGRSAAPLAGGYYGEWVSNSTATWSWGKGSPLEAGFSLRKIRSDEFTNQYPTSAGLPLLIDHSDGTALRLGGYVQQSWNIWAGRLRLTAGARWDHDSIDNVSVVSPQFAASLGLTKATRLQLGWSQDAQYPEVSVFLSPFGNRGLLPERSQHAVVALERRIGQRTRLRAEFYDREDRHLLSQPLLDPRILNGFLFLPPTDPLYYNSLRGHSRGFEIFLQRSSANRFSGWISYAYGHDTMHDAAVPPAPAIQFPSDFDQRHTINNYGSVRVRPTVNLSLRVTYGSGFPIPGFTTRLPDGYYVLSSERNTLRLPAYQRTDLRLNKSWMHDKWKFTLYGEAINLTNHSNYFFQNSSYNTQTGLVSPNFSRTFPFLPSVGMMVEW